MKDYTKYDFAAIVGAEVRLQVKYFGCYKGKVLCRWEYQGKPYLTILVCNQDGSHLSDIPVDEIVPGSLSAKIKVEDMSLKQLEKEFRLDCGRGVVINRKNGVIEIRDFDCEDGIYHEEPLTDYIDCTDWGWKE